MCCTPDIILHFVTKYCIEEDVELKRKAGTTGTALKKENTKYGCVWFDIHIFRLHDMIVSLVSDGLMVLLFYRSLLMQLDTTSLSFIILNLRFSRFSLVALSGFFLSFLGLSLY